MDDDDNVHYNIQRMHFRKSLYIRWIDGMGDPFFIANMAFILSYAHNYNNNNNNNKKVGPYK